MLLNKIIIRCYIDVFASIFLSTAYSATSFLTPFSQYAPKESLLFLELKLPEEDSQKILPFLDELISQKTTATNPPTDDKSKAQPLIKINELFLSSVLNLV